jgi:hypothetical protein
LTFFPHHPTHCILQLPNLKLEILSTHEYCMPL